MFSITSDERLLPAMKRVKEIPLDHLKHEFKRKMSLC